MTLARLLVAALAVSLNIHAAPASELEQTGSIHEYTDIDRAPESPSGVPVAAATPANGESAPVALPKLTVTSAEPVPKPLPPLKPLPKWDPRVCIGC